LDVRRPAEQLRGRLPAVEGGGDLLRQDAADAGQRGPGGGPRGGGRGGDALRAVAAPRRTGAQRGGGRGPGLAGRAGDAVRALLAMLVAACAGCTMNFDRFAQEATSTDASSGSDAGAPADEAAAPDDAAD